MEIRKTKKEFLDTAPCPIAKLVQWKGSTKVHAENERSGLDSNEVGGLVYCVLKSIGIGTMNFSRTTRTSTMKELLARIQGART
jgi:hypothetical protein